MKLTEVKANNRIVKALIEFGTRMKNKNVDTPTNKSILINKGKFIFRTPDRIPQLVYGHINYKIYKKDNKKLTVKEQEQEDTVNKFFKENVFFIDIDQTTTLKTFMANRDCTEILVGEENIKISFKDKAKKGDPEDKEYEIHHVYITLADENEYEEIEYETLNEYDIDLNNNILYNKNGAFIINHDRYYIKLNENNIVLGGKYNEFNKLIVLEDNKYESLIDIVCSPKDEMDDFSKAFTVFGEYHNIYRVVKLDED